MADDIRKVRFNPPVYKNLTTNPGELVEAGDVITIVLKGNTVVLTPPAEPGLPPTKTITNQTQSLTVLRVNESGTEIEYEFDATNQYVAPNRIVGVIPLHTWECPGVGNYETVATNITSITSFEVDGVVHTESYGSATLPGGTAVAAAVQADLNEALQGNGAATVVVVDVGTDYFKIYVMNTTAVVKINGTAIPVQA